MSVSKIVVNWISEKYLHFMSDVSIFTYFLAKKHIRGQRDWAEIPKPRWLCLQSDARKRQTAKSSLIIWRIAKLFLPLLYLRCLYKQSHRLRNERWLVEVGLETTLKAIKVVILSANSPNWRCKDRNYFWNFQIFLSKNRIRTPKIL